MHLFQLILGNKLEGKKSYWICTQFWTLFGSVVETVKGIQGSLIIDFTLETSVAFALQEFFLFFPLFL